MYSRLYTRVLNRWDFCLEAKSFLFPFEDISIFGIQAKCDPRATVSMVEVILSEIVQITRDIGEVEFVRGKNKLKSDMFMDLESRIVQIDDLLRQTLLWGKKIPASQHALLIDAVTIEDVIRVAKNIFFSANLPTVVSHGSAESLAAIPSAKRIAIHLQQLIRAERKKNV